MIYGHLIEQLALCSAKWDTIATGLCFHLHEINGIQSNSSYYASASVQRRYHNNGFFMIGGLNYKLLTVSDGALLGFFPCSHAPTQYRRNNKGFATLQKLTVLNKQSRQNSTINLKNFAES